MSIKGLTDGALVPCLHQQDCYLMGPSAHIEWCGIGVYTLKDGDWSLNAAYTII